MAGKYAKEKGCGGLDIASSSEVLKQRDSDPRGHLTMCADTFDCHNRVDVIGTCGAEARNAAEYPPMHREAPPTTSSLAQT